MAKNFFRRFKTEKGENMHINSINGINFKGLLIVKNQDNTYEKAVNTDQVVEIADMSSKYNNNVIIRLTEGDTIPVKLPFEDVVRAYEKAASTSSCEIKSSKN